MKTTKPRRSAKVTHHRTIRLSHNYNSAEASYGVTFECDDDPASVKEALNRAELIVDRRLKRQVQKDTTVLAQL